MQQFDGGKLFIKITGLSNLGHGVSETTQLGVPISNYVEIKNNIDFICSELEKLELASSLASAKNLKSVIYNEVTIKPAAEMPIAPEARALSGEWAVWEPMTLGRYKNYAKDLVNRFSDELSTRIVVSISPRHAKYLNNETLFGDEVFKAFPNTREDIEEAGKCLAFERPTAAVFHLMRALESAVQAIANKLGATVHDSNGKGLPWGVIADNMKPKIDAMQRGSAEQTKWYRVQNDLVVVNRAWRVPTNHPKETYTPDQAEEVLDATRAFMKELAPLV